MPSTQTAELVQHIVSEAKIHDPNIVAAIELYDATTLGLLYHFATSGQRYSEAELKGILDVFKAIPHLGPLSLIEMLRRRIADYGSEAAIESESVALEAISREGFRSAPECFNIKAIMDKIPLGDIPNNAYVASEFRTLMHETGFRILGVAEEVIPSTGNTHTFVLYEHHQILPDPSAIGDKFADTCTWVNPTETFETEGAFSLPKIYGRAYLFRNRWKPAHTGYGSNGDLFMTLLDPRWSGTYSLTQHLICINFSQIQVALTNGKIPQEFENLFLTGQKNPQQ